VRGSTFENQNADVYVANTDGSGAACLACNQCSESEPSISPDGQSVVYQSTCNGHPDLFVVSASGSEGYYLTNTDSLSEREPAFSPDGKQIIYRVSANNVDRNNNGELYVMDSDGSNAHSLNIQGRGPTWSPDGLKLAYMSNENGPWQIYIYTLTTKNSQKITNCTVNCRWPAWSPNGMYIAYNTTPSASSMEPDSIWYVRSDGSGAATLVVQADRGAGRPSWSASGWIAFNTVNGIEEIRQDGSQRKILINETDAWAPAWSK
jgi:TolB protein